MTDHPSTYQGKPVESGEHAWSDHASLIPIEKKDGVFTRMNAARTGTFAQMIRHIAALPESERSGYVIEKAGDREYSAEEAMKLANEPSFPARTIPDEE